MYYRGVNRGVSFTKAGRYSIGLVILVGFIATGSGYNSLYLSLSFGLGILVVSGLQSEKVMKNYELQSSKDTVADAHMPFNFELRAKNLSNGFYLYGVENVLVTEIPKFRLFSNEVKAVGTATVLALPSGKETHFSGSCKGLARGLYREFHVIQRTSFPFGLLSKFKVTPMKNTLCILPKREEELERQIREVLRQKLVLDRREQQFYSHRSYLSGDSLRHVDWKKSAGLRPQFWSLKTYESTGEDVGVYLDLEWARAQTFQSEDRYEKYLSVARTILDVTQELGRSVVLSGPDGLIGNQVEALRYLAAAPRFKKRNEKFGFAPTQHHPTGKFLHVRVGAQGALLDEKLPLVVL